MYTTVEVIKEINPAIGIALSDSTIEDLILTASRIVDDCTNVDAEGYEDTDEYESVPPEVSSAVIYLVNYHWRILSAAGMDSESVFGRSYKVETPATVNRRLKQLLNKFGYDPQNYKWDGWESY